MPRLRNALTGAVMAVSEATATRLGSEWADADAKARTESPDSTWKVADLKAYAADKGIDLEDATKKEDVLAAITASAEVKPNE